MVRVDGRTDVEDVARVVLAMEQHDVTEEVMHFLDRSGRARVVATAADDRQLIEAVRQLEPDALVAQPSLVTDGVAHAQPFLAIETRESVASLRAAIDAGARGFFVWPADREALSSAAAASLAVPAALDRRATVVAVHAARGGAGATFIATHLARAFARRGRSCVLIDADPMFGEVGAALGTPDDVHTFGDLVPLVAELTPAHLDETLWTHSEGFRVLLAPPAQEAPAVGSDALRRVVEVGASSADVVVLHLARALDAVSRAGLGTADRIVEVLSLDVLSFRAAKRALEALGPLGLDGRVAFVVNRAARGEITPGDVSRVFGQEPLAVVSLDRSVARAQDHGRLVSSRGRTGRAFDRLAKRLEEDA
jgi:Flp pilus assembly CpaE family ATPase